MDGEGLGRRLLQLRMQVLLGLAAASAEVLGGSAARGHGATPCTGGVCRGHMLLPGTGEVDWACSDSVTAMDIFICPVFARLALAVIVCAWWPGGPVCYYGNCVHAVMADSSVEMLATFPSLCRVCIVCIGLVCRLPRVGCGALVWAVQGVAECGDSPVSQFFCCLWFGSRVLIGLRPLGSTHALRKPLGQPGCGAIWLPW